MTYTVQTRSRKHGRKDIGPFSTLAKCSEAYANLRDETCEGASTFGEGTILWEGTAINWISYNARVWERPSSEWLPGAQPVYDPARG